MELFEQITDYKFFSSNTNAISEHLPKDDYQNRNDFRQIRTAINKKR